MNTATIYFSNNSKLTLSENDSLIPIVSCSNSDGSFASMGEHAKLYNHVHDGLFPSIMDALCFCNFFYVNSNDSTIYGVSSIVKIENN